MFFLFGTFGWIMGIFVWFFIPETKGISLEKMDELFGVTELVKKLDDQEADIPATEVHEAGATEVHEVGAMQKEEKV
jgi:hypothetical protein